MNAAPFAGEVSATDGSWFGASTAIPGMADEVVWAPSVSNALAVNDSILGAQDQVNDRTVRMNDCPEQRRCPGRTRRAHWLSGSDAVAVMSMAAGAVNVPRRCG